MIKRYLFSIFTLLLSTVAFAQKGAIKGVVKDAKSGKPIAEALVEIKEAKVATTTDAGGKFEIGNLKTGSYAIEVSADDYQSYENSITVSEGVTSVGTIELEHNPEKTTEAAAGDANQAGANQDVADDEVSSGGAQNVGSALNASRDPFNSAAGFNWGQFFFRVRGLENEHSVAYINGIPMNDLEDGNATFNTWTGLNDVFRSRTTVVGLGPNDLMYGGLGNTISMDASASVQRKQTRVTMSNTNRSYRNRLMITHSTGLMKSGWAFSVSASRRWANEGVIPGTFFDAYSFYAAAEKRIKNHSIGIIAVGTPQRRGRQGTAMQELYDLAGTNLYSPNWGYQNGKVRNARQLEQFLPFFILSDEITLKNNGKLLAAISYQTGYVESTGFDWYNSHNPQPDYYRNLPSYLAVDGNETAAAELTSYLKANPDKLQIQWDDIYASNQQGNQNIPGIAGKRSNYILGADVEKHNRVNIALNYEKVISDHFTFFAGATNQNQVLNYYRQVYDLLGGDYWYNVNQFAERTFNGIPTASVNDLNETEADRVKKVGDKYGYNYRFNFAKSALWTQGVFTFPKVDFFVAANSSFTRYARTGNTQVGLYADNSKGRSNTQEFLNAGAKGGITYKINGRHYIYANAATQTNAPFMDNVFVSPRTRNQTTTDVLSEKVFSTEAGYLLRSPNMKARVTVFHTQIKDATDIKRFFDQIANSFVNMSLQPINKRYQGIEIGTEIKASTTISITGAVAFSSATFTNRPKLISFVDNDTTSTVASVFGTGDSMWAKGLRLPSGPQTALSIGAMYRSPKFWMLNVNFNYLANNYMDFAPNKHVSSYVDLMKVTQGEAAYNRFVTQQKLNDFYTIDVSFNKSWKANKFFKKANSRNLIFLNLSVNNILNNKNIQLLGFENLRADIARPTLFDARYTYNIGAQYFINLAYSF
jgi:hypothetical protein